MLVLLSFALFALSAAQAGVILVSESGLGANGFIDLTSLGGDGTVFPSAVNATATGIPGLTVDITDAGNLFMRVSQGNGWTSGFSPGEPLLYTLDSSGPITLAFSSPVMGVGMQIESDAYGSYSAMLEAFDSTGNSLGSVIRTGGISAPNGANDSAIFIGIRSDIADVKTVRISLPTAAFDPTAFAINGPLIRSAGAEVPEPASVLLFGAGGLALLAFARRRRSA